MWRAWGVTVLLYSTATHGFSSAPLRKKKAVLRPLQMKATALPQPLFVKGGAVVSGVASALGSGPLGVPALAGVASVVVLPLTTIREAYSFSVGYGASVAAMGAAMLAAFGAWKTPLSAAPSSLLAWAVTAYGARLALYLLLRQATVPSIAERIKSFDKTPRAKRAPLALSVALFYACMTCPTLFALRSPSASPVAAAGAAVAWAGVVIEAVTDGQKYLVKKKQTSEDDVKTFSGPTGGFFAMSRHANCRVTPYPPNP